MNQIVPPHRQQQGPGTVFADLLLKGVEIHESIDNGKQADGRNEQGNERVNEAVKEVAVERGEHGETTIRTARTENGVRITR
jgi:hypothetical protein